MEERRREKERNVFDSGQKPSREANEVYKGNSNYIQVVLFGLKKKKKRKPLIHH